MVLYFQIIAIIISVAIVLLLGLLITFGGLSIYKKFLKKEIVTPPYVPPITTTVEMINLTKELEAFLDQEIQFQTVKELQPIQALGEKYDIRTLDKSVQNISDAVYQGLEPFVFNTQYVIKTEYVLSYIIARTRMYLLSAALEYNKTV